MDENSGRNKPSDRQTDPRIGREGKTTPRRQAAIAGVRSLDADGRPSGGSGASDLNHSGHSLVSVQQAKVAVRPRLGKRQRDPGVWMRRAAGLLWPVGAPTGAELNVARDRARGRPEQRRTGAASGESRNKQAGDQHAHKHPIYKTDDPVERFRPRRR